MKPRFSVVIPVFNRPQELSELLESLVAQTVDDFEVIVVEDGSDISSEKVVEAFRNRLELQYLYHQNAGPGPSRNLGFEHARGEIFIVLDSDTILPPGYLAAVDAFLKDTPLDLWGGPDRAREDFTALQRAIGYTMTSFLTTGGIRGRKTHVGQFQPRSFNMGMTREAYARTGGFRFTHYAEDVELSIRARKLGLRIGLIYDAGVYHKRRTNFRQFYRQVFHFGMGRARVGRVHPDQERLIHWLPLVFVLGLVGTLAGLWHHLTFLFLSLEIYAFYFLALFADALTQSRNVLVAFLTVPTAAVQLTGYGLGFLWGKLRR